MRKIAIIGGGAAGLFCSIRIKEHLGEEVQVILLEKQDRVGKKILATGNGKCNLSNQFMNSSYYNTKQVAYALREVSPSVVEGHFKRWGLWTKTDEEGRMYPYSEKATSVLDVLLHQVEKIGVQIKQFEVSHIKALDHFLVYSRLYQLENVDVVVIATGGLTGGGDASGYQLAKSLGHPVTPQSPRLVALKTKESLKHLSGLRIKASAKVMNHEECLWDGVGEVLFKDQGLSGILMFDCSRYMQKGCQIVLDCAYDVDDKALDTFLATNPPEQLGGLLPKMLASEILKRWNEDPHHELIWHIHHLTFLPIGDYGYQNAQVTRGGVDIHSINPTTFESILVPNLYLIGEVLDVDGACGGYNLHFAWASADVASRAIAQQTKGDNQ